MKRMESKMLAVIGRKCLVPLALCGLVMLTGCVDNLDNPTTPDQPGVDPVTQEAYENEDLMDRTVKPGDSFYDFALGTWLRNRDSDDLGLTMNATKKLMQTCAMGFMFTSDPVADKLTTIANNTNKSAEAEAMASIEPKMTAAYLMITSDAGDEVIDVTMRADVIEMVASLVKKGYSPLVKSTVTPLGGKFVKALTAGDINSNVREALEVGDEDTALEAVKALVERMVDVDEENVDEDDVDMVAEFLFEIDKKVFEASNDYYSDDLRLRASAKPTPTVKPSLARARRRAESANLYTLLGITDENSVVDEQVSTVLNILDTEDPDNLVVYLMYNLIGENIDLLDNAPDGFDWDDDDDDDDDDLQLTLYEKLMEVAPEVISRVDYKFLSDNEEINTEGCRTMMEQMRTLMDSRISSLDWMSNATKAAARQKLAAMTFNIGAPATKPGASLTLTFDEDEQETAVGAVQQLRQQRYEAMMKLADDNVPVAGHGWNLLIQMMPLSTLNAFYAPTMNQLFILPAFLGSQLFPKDNEAMSYATAMVFGHELCHGFDTTGALYDATGAQTDWWTAADKAEFQKRADKMVALYNQLKQYGDVSADGLKTLDENIADLGGTSLAFALYKQKLAADGLTADEQNHQLREFFLHVALLWQEAPSDEELAVSLLTDEHSAAHNRVNGVNRLLDEWYELFRVTSGKNYLAPADRVKIW